MRWKKGISRYVNIRRGVRQGCNISSVLLTCIVIDSKVSTFQCKIISVRYANDAVLIEETRKTLQRMMDKLNVSLESKVDGMVINVKKTKVMIVLGQKKKRAQTVVKNVLLEQVDIYQHMAC